MAEDDPRARSARTGQTKGEPPSLPPPTPVDDPVLPAWPRLGSQHGPDYGIFRVRLDAVSHPRTGRALTRVVLEAPDWVNVIALTAEGRVVLVRQFRFGSRHMTIEIPGGVVDAGESSRQAAARELLEETGYAADRWTSLGWVEPNPAFLDNVCHHWLAEGARQVQAPQPDGGEDIEVLAVEPEELVAMIRRGDIRHSLVISAVCRLFDLRPWPGVTGTGLEDPGWEAPGASNP